MVIKIPVAIINVNQPPNKNFLAFEKRKLNSKTKNRIPNKIKNSVLTLRRWKKRRSSKVVISILIVIERP
jgi:hypothetical protein